MAKRSFLPVMLLAITALSTTAVTSASGILGHEVDTANDPLLSRNLADNGRRHRLFPERKYHGGQKSKSNSNTPQEQSKLQRGDSKDDGHEGYGLEAEEELVTEEMPSLPSSELGGAVEGKASDEKGDNEAHVNGNFHFEPSVVENSDFHFGPSDVIEGSDANVDSMAATVNVNFDSNDESSKTNVLKDTRSGHTQDSEDHATTEDSEDNVEHQNFDYDQLAGEDEVNSTTVDDPDCIDDPVERRKVMRRNLKHKTHKQQPRTNSHQTHGDTASGKSGKAQRQHATDPPHEVVKSGKSSKRSDSGEYSHHLPPPPNVDAKSSKDSSTHLFYDQAQNQPNQPDHPPTTHPPTTPHEGKSGKSAGHKPHNHPKTSPHHHDTTKSGKSASIAKSAKAAKGAKGVVKCTNPPTNRPSRSPVSRTPNPTKEPTVPTTEPPTETIVTPEPTIMKLTEEPTKVETVATDSPTRFGTPLTEPPATTPSPTVELTPAPVPVTPAPNVETSFPTESTSASPTDSPTAEESSSPTTSPVGVPVATESPVAGTSLPTSLSPTVAVADSASPTQSPSASVVESTGTPSASPTSNDGTVEPTQAPTNPPTTESPVAGTSLPISLSPTVAGTDSASPTQSSSTSVVETTGTPSTISPISSDGTVEPTQAPTNLPVTSFPTATLDGTLSPTVAIPPINAIYYDSFENGTFLPGNLEWTTTNEADPALVWELSSERANRGEFSIKSPNLSNEDLTSGSSNVTFTTNPDWPSGNLIFWVLPSVFMPYDQFQYYVDGELQGAILTSSTEFEERVVELPGSGQEHVIDFVYSFNPTNAPAMDFPPESTFPGREGAVYIDDVYFVPSDVIIGGDTVAPTSTPSTVATGDTIPPTIATVTGTIAPTSTATGGDTFVPTPTNDTGTVTVAPTTTPDGAIYYKGFEQGTFPEGDIEWTTANNNDEDLVWELTTERASSGVYSIRSPVLENEDKTSGSANATLNTNPDWPSGYLHFSALPSIQLPFDQFAYYVDGQLQNETVVAPESEFGEWLIPLESGQAHVIDFVYTYNPNNIPSASIPPAVAFTGREGVVFIDDVYFVPGDIPVVVDTLAPTTSLTGGVSTSPTVSPAGATSSSVSPTASTSSLLMTTPPTPVASQAGPLPCVPLEPNPDSFEDGTFPLPPWSTTGDDGVWALSTDKAYRGTTSLLSPDLDGIPAAASSSNATLQLCDDFQGGVVRLQAIASVQPPMDIFIIFIDGESETQLVDVNEWTEIDFELAPGPHKIEFSYQYNPFGMPAGQLPPRGPTTEGAVWIDSVTIEEQ